MALVSEHFTPRTSLSSAKLRHARGDLSQQPEWFFLKMRSSTTSLTVAAKRGKPEIQITSLPMASFPVGQQSRAEPALLPWAPALCSSDTLLMLWGALPCSPDCGTHSRPGLSSQFILSFLNSYLCAASLWLFLISTTPVSTLSWPQPWGSKIFPSFLPVFW